MSRFKLKELSFQIRDMNVTVRELTQAQRLELTKNAQTDVQGGPALLASMSCVDPKLTAAEWSEEPGDVVSEVVDHIMVLCGMKSKLGPAKEGEDAAKKA